MIIEGQNFEYVDAFANPIAVADSWVKGKNKIGEAHGEAKLYISSKDSLHEFYGTSPIKCFMLKRDLAAYMNAIKTEYLNPSQNYRGREEMPQLWETRMNEINKLDDVIEFTVFEQIQIEGNRGYVNSEDSAYQLIREIALPCVSYISTMRLKLNGYDMYYWRLFADFTEMDIRRNYIESYGRGSEQNEQQPTFVETSQLIEYRYARIGQGKYRKAMLEECPFCPITRITEESLLIASHIKPWAVSDNTEKIDPKNGFILSPLYDKLFDRGFITFDENRRVHISNWLSQQDKKRIGIKENQSFPKLPIDTDRCKYLSYHQNMVFRG